MQLLVWLVKGMREPLVEFVASQIPILYSYELDGGIYSEILNYFISMVDGKEVELRPVKEDHLGFGISINVAGGPDYLSNRLQEFEQRYDAGELFNNDLGKRVLQDANFSAHDVLQGICEQAGMSCDGLNIVSYDEIDRKLQAGREIELSDIIVSELREWYVQGDPVVNLTDSKTADKVANRLNKFAMGNEGYATVERLEFNLSTYVLSCDFTLHHEHHWRIGAAARRE